MSSFIRGNRDLIKDMNRNLLLNIIRREKRISRKQLTDVSGLSVGSVSGIVNELLSNHWILEIGEGEYTGGRRQTLITLNPNAGYAIGLKLMERRLVVALTNFETEIIAYQESTYPFDSNPQKLIHILSENIQSLIQTSQIHMESLFGVGIGLAGVVYSNSGIVHHSPFFGWRDIPLAAMLEREINLPVYIENDVNTLTLTEQLFGAGRYYENFIVVTVGRGIGMGLVLHNQIYRGVRGGAGEFGHTILAQSIENGIASQYSTLENAAADLSVIGNFNKHSIASAQTSELAEIVKQAELGNVSAQKALARSGELLGIGLANVINMLNPELIIVSGEGTIAGNYRIQPMLDAMKKYTFNGLLDDVKVVIEPTDDRAWARGAASLVISKMFESPIIDARMNT